LGIALLVVADWHKAMTVGAFLFLCKKRFVKFTDLQHTLAAKKRHPKLARNFVWQKWLNSLSKSKINQNQNQTVQPA
jgi:hypothetical protein